MARQRAAAKTKEELVQHALTLAATNPKAKWTGATAKALFNTNDANSQAAIDECTNAERPLLEKTGTTGTLTADGFGQVAATLPPVKAVELAALVAHGLTPTEKVAFLGTAISRTPGAVAELAVLLEAALKSDEVTNEARVTAAAKRKTADDTAKEMMQRVIRLIDEAREKRLDALRREYEAEGGKASELPEHKQLRKTAPDNDDEPPVPKTGAEKDFRRYTADRLASAWRDAME